MATILEDVVSVAQRAVDTFHDRSGGKLDFSESSLAIVEEMLAEASIYVADMPESQVSALVRMLGCYVLEVARARHGGEYTWVEHTDEPVLVVGDGDTHVAIAAWGKVRSRLGGDPADSIPFFYQGFADAVNTPSPGKRTLFV
jgi:predicted ATPase